MIDWLYFCQPHMLAGMKKPRLQRPDLTAWLAPVPGLLLCAGVAALAMAGERAESTLTGRAWLEALVLAILLGTLIRTVFQPSARFEAGIRYASKTVLEVAVALMGAMINFDAVVQAGLPLVGGIAAIVVLSIAGSFALARVLGLPAKMATLLACGNAICGNSAIAAVAPVIEAESDDVGAAIAFTAVLGVAVVLLLPLASTTLHLSPLAGGAFAGLTVYAVPQVLAAAGPMGAGAVQIGILVKLVRVLMLGPVVALLGLVMLRTERTERGEEPAASAALAPARHSITHFLPWFILAFLAMMTLRSTGLFPSIAIEPTHHAAGILTVVSMAGLGLGVDIRSVAAAGPRITVAVVLSLLLLAASSLGLLWLIKLV